MELIVPGLFNVYNSLAAIAIGRELGMDTGTIREGWPPLPASSAAWS